MGAVKSARPTRAERARQTRRRMLDSARALFIGDGYAATTMDRIAEHAGVAVQTLYYTFRTKGQLLCEVVEVTAAGDEDAPPVHQRAWVQQMLTATSGQRVLALAVEHGADIFVRAAPLWPAVAAATGTLRSRTTGGRSPPTGAPARPGWWPSWTSSARCARGSTPTEPLTSSSCSSVTTCFAAGQRGRLERSGVQELAPHRAGPTTPATAQAHSHRLLRPVLRDLIKTVDPTAVTWH